MMIPPIDPLVLKTNPEFAKLYSSLTRDVLAEDGSTKNDAATKQRCETRLELKAYRLRHTKKHILKTALATVPPPTSQAPARQLRQPKSQLSNPPSQEAAQLPQELLDLILLITPFLDGAQSMHSADLELLLSNPPFSEFPALLPQLTPIISSHISVQARGLARVLFPSTNPSFIHRAIPQILPTTQTLLSNLSSSREALTSSRLAATSNLVVHLNQQAEALSLLLQALEAKNGPAALSSTLRAWKGSLEAQTWAAALNLLLSETRVHVYPLEAQAALENYSRHLRDAQMQLSNKLRTRELELGEYGLSIGPEGGGSGTRRANNEREQKFRELARVWNEMEKRMKEVNGELKRLDRN